MTTEKLEWIHVGSVDDLPEGRVKTVTARTTSICLSLILMANGQQWIINVGFGAPGMVGILIRSRVNHRADMKIPARKLIPSKSVVRIYMSVLKQNRSMFGL